MKKGLVRHVEGVVSSVGGAHGRPPTFEFHLQPWREVDGEQGRGELRVEVELTDAKRIGPLMTKWNGRALRVKVECTRAASTRFLEINVARSPLRAIEYGAELGRRAAALKARRIRSRTLGTLALDVGSGWFRGARGGYEVAFESPYPEDRTAVAEALARAEAAVTGVERRLPLLRQASAEELLATHNRRWNTGGKALSEHAFRRRHRLSAVEVGSTGVTVYFDTADLFGEHGVEIRLGPDLEIEEVLIS